ncbi:hypothetical protein BAUCODRAFT_147489 [Baudoinia panamericana UAMH 10762]|uniref:GPI ethanolamine phosphate transferase 2 n=1 Tax=Baudoinia panamericana (strain UAMH 10762) TaxID=717646 RepID=M2ML40_BAUPA|nr:uncharacterized protein BAUCODRAFT_147489 [Baudoinia panamericana UAMH 10762]EMC97401.1 hypothetical protein BAUCODRAFT_147489 [Baudoinia panamericana UAMH 10762]
MARSRMQRLTALATANALLPIAAIVFAFGFFPYKPLLPGLATFPDAQDTSVWGHGQPEAIFDRVVFMVVDALRTDFVYGYNSGFEFTQSLIRNGAAIPFTAHATPPTVTMPRVKALTTGSVPSFADLIFNLDESGSGSTLATQDTWLAQIKVKGGKLVFYGDDTWLRLFPGDFFERADGTSSFFVSDFTEVDNNVTRHVPDELMNSDWNALIMHYLGLDHIGHKTGPNGPNMLPKQREMDGIVRMIYESMESSEHLANTLLVLAGDHGMNAGGNHGGSGPGETEPALLFASPKLKARRDRIDINCPTAPRAGTDFHYYRKVEQSDIVPTLAGLMQLPIPKNSLGVFIHELAGLWPEHRHGTQILHQNGKQVMHIVEAAYGVESFRTKVASRKLRVESLEDAGFDRADDEIARLWVRTESALHEAAADQMRDVEIADHTCLSFLIEAQETLSNAASTYDVPRMVAGIVLSMLAAAFAALSIPAVWPPSTAGVFFALIALLYGMMMFASSFVEEEQRLWYWLTPAWVSLLLVRSIVRTRDARNKLRAAISGLGILAVHRLAIGWDQTGQKHAGEPDIVHTFFPNYHALMWMLVLITYLYFGFKVAQRSLMDIIAPDNAAVVAFILVAPAIVFKLNFTQADAPELVQRIGLQIRSWTRPFSLVAQAQLAFALQGLVTIAVAALAVGLARGSVIGKRNGPAVRVTLAERLHYVLSLFLTMQTRAPNIPLFLGLEAQRAALAYLLHSTDENHKTQLRRNALISSTELATTALLFSHTYFFCMGGSNSISSVDLSNAYNGVGGYNIVAVGVLLFASNWAGPIWWCSAACTVTFRKLANPSADKLLRTEDQRSWIYAERTKLQRDAAQTTAEPAEGHTVPDSWLEYASLMTVFVATGLLAVMAACTALRTHLFIWTVFSPKYLYALAWCIGWHMVVNIGFGSLLRWLGNHG